MEKSWVALQEIASGSELILERVYIKNRDITLEGQFILPPLALLSYEDQVFVSAFIRSHGSIKEMEHLFGVSYPTIKNRLNKISENFGFLEVKEVPSTSSKEDGRPVNISSKG